MGTISEGIFWIALIRVGIFWVRIFQVEIFQVGILEKGVILDGSFPGGNFQVGVILGGNFLQWGFSGWELSGKNHPGGAWSFPSTCNSRKFSGSTLLQNLHSLPGFHSILRNLRWKMISFFNWFYKIIVEKHGKSKYI